MFKQCPYRLTALFARSLDIDQGRSALVRAIGRKLQELTLHRVDVSDIGCNEVIAAAFTGHHLKVAPGESGRGTRAAEMDEGREILLLARARLYIARAGENISDMAVQIHGRQFDGMARDRADIEAGEAAAGLHDHMIPDAEPRGLRVGAVDHLVETDGAGGGLVDRERVETPPPAPIGAVHRIARTLDLRQRGQQFRGDRAGRVGAEQRPVLADRKSVV